MSLFVKAPKPIIVAPTAGADRSGANGEIKIKDTFDSQTNFFNKFYEYLDKTGATFPNIGNNTGLEGQYIANKAIKSEHLTPIANSGTFQAGNTTLTTFNDVFVSNEININVPFANARILWNVAFNYQLSAVAGTAAANMSVIFGKIKRGNTGFLANAGTTIFSKANRAGQDNNIITDDFGFQVIDTLTAAGNYYYRFTAQEAQNTSYNRIIEGAVSTYSYIVLNGVS